MTDGRRRLLIAICGAFYLIAAILLEPPYTFGGSFRIYAEAGMFLAAISCFAVSAFPIRTWLRAASLVIVTVVSLGRGFALVTEFNLYLPAAQWFYIACLQLVLWPHLLPLPDGYGRPAGT